MAEKATLSERGIIFAISSPSGAGKSTIARRLLEDNKNLSLSVSVTTRPRRSSEIEGKDYHFIDIAAFDRLRASNALLEWAQVHGNFYGTPSEPVEKQLSAGRDVLVDIDWQGADQMAKSCGADLVRIFILPPSAQELHERLKRRAQDTTEVINKRLRNAIAEIAHWSDYDYVIVNHDLQESVAAAKAILLAEKFRRQRQPGLDSFVSDLQGGLSRLDLGD